MNWYISFILLVLIAFTALILGACAYHVEQCGNTLAMHSILANVVLLMILGASIFRGIQQ